MPAGFFEVLCCENWNESNNRNITLINVSTFLLCQFHGFHALVTFVQEKKKYYSLNLLILMLSAAACNDNYKGDCHLPPVSSCLATVVIGGVSHCLMETLFQIK